jgi:hypothetical protein
MENKRQPDELGKRGILLLRASCMTFAAVFFIDIPVY